MHIDWFILLCQILNFLLLVYLLKRFLYGRIIKAMDDREAKIAARFADAEEMKEKAAREAGAYEQNNRQLDAAKEKMLNEAALAAEARRTELMEAVRRDVGELGKRWKDMLSSQQEAFFYDLRRRAAGEIYATARRALSDLAHVDLEERIIDEFIRLLRGLDREKSEEIRRAVGSAGNRVTVRSAFGIGEERQVLIESALKDKLPDGFTISYQTQPEVVSGIEMRVNGHKIAWSIDEYLDNLVETMSETLQREAYSG